MKKRLSLLLAAIMLLGMAGAAAEQAKAEAPLVVATDVLSQRFSPYYADTEADRAVVELTQMNMMTRDRAGDVVYNGIEGETRSWNGTDYTYYGTGDLSVEYDGDADRTTYTYRMRDDLKFSDGKPASIDDVIFNYYVYLDPAYRGPIALSGCDIVGLEAYRTQIPEAHLKAVNAVIDAVRAVGPEYAARASDPFTADAYTAYYDGVDALWTEDVRGIVDYVYDVYAPDYAEVKLGRTSGEVGADDGLKAALGMLLWGFGDLNDDKTVLTSAANVGFNIGEGEYPAIEDFLAAAKAKYGGDFDAYLAANESAAGITAAAARAALSARVADALGIDVSAGVPNVAGIRRVDDHTVEVVTHGFDATDVYAILGLDIAPMHYYGDPEQYDCEHNRFGHPFGDLSAVQSKNDCPMGGGAYRFVQYGSGAVSFEANAHYWRGAPKIKALTYRETGETDAIDAVRSGDVDIAEVPGDKSVLEALCACNSDGEISGDVVTAAGVANLGYGYIGMNADTMNVAGEPGSDASRNLRKGFATLLAVYRDAAVEGYYGDAATVIEYPVSATAWTAPQADDPDYRAAYSVDVDGNDIYTTGMDREARYAAALAAAVGFFRAAGYTFDEATGRFVAAPEGASLSYEALIPGKGVGDHPLAAALADAKEALAGIGIELTVTDPADENAMWDALEAGTQDIWCAAWVIDVDSDMCLVYQSADIVGRGGSDTNPYHLQSDILDRLIVNARESAEPDLRAQLFSAALDVIVDWAVEVPAYRRQDVVVANARRVDPATMTPDITAFYRWTEEIQNIGMNEAE